MESEILEVRKQEQPPKTMRELENRIFQAGEQWREEHTEIKVNESTGQETVKVSMPQTFTVAKILSDIVTFTFISKSNISDYSLLYIYDLDEGIYTASNDLFNQFCKTFDVRIKPREWSQIKLMVRTLTRIKRPLDSAHLIPVQNGIIDLKTKDLLPFSPKYVITSKINTAYHTPKRVPTDREGKTFDDWLNSIWIGYTKLDRIIKCVS